MLLVAEIALFCFGLYVLIGGKISRKGIVVLTGWRARIIGLVYLLPLPLSLVGGAIFGILWVLSGHDPKDRSVYGYALAIEVACFIACLLAAWILQRRFRIQLAEQEEDTPPMI
ncbi:hypothetical protein BH10PLA2_BH10PLA2_17180 [soil metagenome]